MITTRIVLPGADGDFTTTTLQIVDGDFTNDDVELCLIDGNSAR